MTGDQLCPYQTGSIAPHPHSSCPPPGAPGGSGRRSALRWARLASPAASQPSEPPPSLDELRIKQLKMSAFLLSASSAVSRPTVPRGFAAPPVSSQQWSGEHLEVHSLPHLAHISNNQTNLIKFGHVFMEYTRCGIWTDVFIQYEN